MEPLTLQVQHGQEEAIECWDNDGDLQCYEDIQLRTASSATSVTNSSIRLSGHRDSISSRRSARSDIDSTGGGDEDWQVQLLDDEESVNEEALASAKIAGIPLPKSIPRSALVGGIIRRLGPRRTRDDFVDDWSDDVEFPDPDVVLELKSPQVASFPESLQQIGSTTASPVKAPASPCWSNNVTVRLRSAIEHSDGSRVDCDAGDVEGIPTIRPTLSRPPQRTSVINDSMLIKERDATRVFEDFEEDIELPQDDFLRLPSRKVGNARSSSPCPEDFDVEFSEGSIGVRFGGTARDHRSNPSSSLVSPSVSSYLTGESDDEGLDGLVIPEGPLDLDKSMRKRHESSTLNMMIPESAQATQDPTELEDFFSGFELESDNMFDTRRLSINPNVKCKTDRIGSPGRRSATTLTFTNTTPSPRTRIPRLSGHDRQHSTHLETVSESGAPLLRFRTSLPRPGGHSSHTSVPTLPPSESVLTSPSSTTPNRRPIGTRFAKDPFCGERFSSAKQSLKTKRSLPTMRNSNSAVSTSSIQSTRQDFIGCPAISTTRSKTPTDRIGSDKKLSSRKSRMPCIPPGASEHQPHHASVKTCRYSRRTNSDSSSEVIIGQGSVSHLPRSSRFEVAGSSAVEPTSEALFTTTKRTLTRPARRRNFGDGTELGSFDDLPTSALAESKFVKHPSSRGVPKSLNNKLNRSEPIPSRAEPQQKVLSTTPKLHKPTPRFARDTNASRNAREQRIASMTTVSKIRDGSALTSLSSNWKTQQNIARVPLNSASIRNKKNRNATVPGCRPHLIKPLGTGVQERKSINGMRYNPATFRWEGNENLAYELDTNPKSPKPSPALITNMGAMQNVQVVGSMVFDPQRMCWLKLAPVQPGTKGVIAVQDEDDVFAGLGDLEGKSECSGPRTSGAYDNLGFAASGDDRSCGDSSDEWPITEEFDVGPEFIRRQRAEEEKWRRKVNKWVDFDRRKLGDSWRWAIRDLVGFNSTPVELRSG